MKKTNALEMRRSLGAILKQLEGDGAPVLVERNRRPAAVLICLRDYRERFVDAAAAEERQSLADDLLDLRRRAHPSRRSVVRMLRELRGPLA
jgi:PHD/YefM family antitoxin component YafN of YafNO toxin-antitoxin module